MTDSAVFCPPESLYDAVAARIAHLARRAKWSALGYDEDFLALRERADRENALFDQNIASGRRFEKERVAARAAIQASREARGLSPHPINLIKQVVARAFNITIHEMDSPRRAVTIVEPRHVAVYLAYTITRTSLPELGRRFGDRDHTSILHAVRKISARVASDPEFAVTIGLLRAEIEGDA
jgi:chromosomal replication initiation ATPase DnaA